MGEGARAGVVEYQAPAKINLYLHVLDRRDDGYHDIESLVVFAAFGDVVEVRAARSLTLSVTGPFADVVPKDESNIVHRAACRLAAALGETRGAAIAVTKNLPVAAGLGGGSADAAAALRGLSDLWQSDLPRNELQALALELGADLPVCLAGHAAFVRGVGERLRVAAELPAAPIVLANPGVPLPTAQVFANLSGRFGASLSDLPAVRDGAALASSLAPYRNDLTTSAIELVPSVATVLSFLADQPGARLARMSGSGPTCFALFTDAPAARRAASRARAAYPGWWAIATHLAP
ncbi:MAG: 4-(cytidine 5'-diphospho)-2-C-methyl-D-erythritol kinase [Alphaproteobacteria bacterium]|nr:4-(cytidine 5'-diphospho)-2-C-methyl-D-erythritol kinase [Alphaproteobacteria bacterium]